MNKEFGVVTDKNDPNFGRTRTTVMSRAMGYIRPVSNFNEGKKSEFDERRTFLEKLCFKRSKDDNQD